jgi:hypothetical protein
MDILIPHCFKAHLDKIEADLRREARVENYAHLGLPAGCEMPEIHVYARDYRYEDLNDYDVVMFFDRASQARQFWRWFATTGPKEPIKQELFACCGKDENYSGVPATVGKSATLYRGLLRAIGYALASKTVPEGLEPPSRGMAIRS